MTRRVTDALIILAVLALGATHMWAQAGGRRTTQVNPAGGGSHVVQSRNVPNGRAVQSHNVPNGQVVPSHPVRSFGGNAQAFGGTTGASPFGAAGPAPLGAAGPAPIGAAGPAPIGAAGPAPIGAAGAAPIGGAGVAPIDDGASMVPDVGSRLPAGCRDVGGGGVVCGGE